MGEGSGIYTYSLMNELEEKVRAALEKNPKDTVEIKSSSSTFHNILKNFLNRDYFVNEAILNAENQKYILHIRKRQNA